MCLAWGEGQAYAVSVQHPCSKLRVRITEYSDPKLQQCMNCTCLLDCCHQENPQDLHTSAHQVCIHKAVPPALTFLTAFVKSALHKCMTVTLRTQYNPVTVCSVLVDTIIVIVTYCLVSLFTTTSVRHIPIWYFCNNLRQVMCDLIRSRSRVIITPNTSTCKTRRIGLSRAKRQSKVTS